MTDKKNREKQLEDVLYQIAELGKGVREDSKDYINIGKIAVSKAKEVLSGRCKACNRANVYLSRGKE